MNGLKKTMPGLLVRCELRAGAIVCYDNSLGYLVPVVTPCSTPGYYPPPVPTTPPATGTQWLSCQQCTGTNAGPGQLAPASCEVCNM